MNFGILLLALLSVFSGVLQIFWGMAVAGAGGLSWLGGLFVFEQTIRAWGGSAVTGGVLGIVVGIVQIGVGFGLVGRQSWAWWLAALSAAFAFIHPLVGFFSGNFWALVGLLIPGAILFYLFKAPIRSQFVN